MKLIEKDYQQQKIIKFFDFLVKILVWWFYYPKTCQRQKISAIDGQMVKAWY